MIIDFHTHVHPDPKGLGEKRDASAEAFLQAFDASPVDQAVLLSIEPEMPTAFIAEIAKQRPGKLLPFGSANPRTGPVCVETFDRQVAEHKVRGLKLHPRRQGFSAADFPVVCELVQLVAAHDLPVLIDCFPYGKNALRDDTLELIAALAEAVPKAKLVIAHMGGHRVLEALIVARTSYTIFFDLSLILSVYRGSHIEQDIFYAIRRLGPDRCVYGSDYPDVGLTESYDTMRRALEQRGCGESDLEQIFSGTAARLLKLEKGDPV